MGGGTLNPIQMTQNPYIRGDTSNPNQMNQHSHLGGDILNPKTLNQMTHQKLPTLQGGGTFQTPIFGDRQPGRGLAQGTHQTLNEVDEMLKQLQKTQANISLWGLLMALHKHRQNLVDLPNQIQVPTTTTSQDLNAMIGFISRELTNSYSDKDLTKKGKCHNDPLHITIDAKGKRIPMVLIDNGSALNVCPLKTISYLGLSMCDLINM